MHLEVCILVEYKYYITTTILEDLEMGYWPGQIANTISSFLVRRNFTVKSRIGLDYFPDKIDAHMKLLFKSKYSRVVFI